MGFLSNIMAAGASNTANGTANGNGTHGDVSARYKNLASHFIGGSHLDVAPPGKVKDFVAEHEGHTVISKVCRFPESANCGSFDGGT
jgi:acetyl-CoA carboxylase/biotin carboxylase 1